MADRHNSIYSSNEDEYNQAIVKTSLIVEYSQSVYTHPTRERLNLRIGFL